MINYYFSIWIPNKTVCKTDFASPDTWEVIFPAGTIILISDYTVHRDPRHFPDPERLN